MGITKSQLFSKDQNELAELAKTLGHPARIAILHYLLQSNSCINSDLVDELGLAQATISQHLKALKSQGLIKGSVEGNSMCYCINTENWNSIAQKFSALFNSYNPNQECC